MKTLLQSINYYFPLNNTNNCLYLYYCIIILVIIFIINRCIYFANYRNNSYIKIKSSISISPNQKIVFLDLKNVRLVLGITTDKIVVLHRYENKKFSSKKEIKSKKI
ncbi:flagellar biosynthetic protein FliO [Buchnera aphidicola]|uniref:flagellar biosynthetic protein FliO n=1 Tax=Buchnera aphidicola TaxID=9 RepID=UPI0022383A43|nr:flagellar biosynthetic protein FliO [Buchnera aphidicola]MCW5197591.1 flagellar biosynthetic protein FliO [Buchnera aphidicola (Chaitophorus viminalis)]